jgi:integrase/recombinase XerD
MAGGASNNLTADAAIAAYLASCRARGLSPKTLQVYAYALHPLRIGSQRLPDRPEALENVLAAVQGSPETRHQVFRALRTFYTWAAHRYGAPNTAQQLAPPQRRHLLPRTLSDDQVDHLLRTPAGRRDRALLVLLLDTGLRVGEAATLTRDNIGATSITVSGKVGQRLVPISPQALAALIGVGNGRALWTGPKGDLTVSGVAQAVRRALRRAGISGGPHLLRHTFGRLYITAGGDVFSLQRILGHRQVETTKRYVELDLRDVLHQHQLFSPIARRPAAAQGRLLQ